VREAVAFAGDDLQTLRKRIESQDFLSGDGSVQEINVITPYIAHLKKTFNSCGEGVHVIVDYGNGVSGPVYTKALRETGCRVTELFAEPDGNFPNHIADPSKLETLRDLQKTVQKEGADFGLAFDGDGDRLGIVDERGSIRSTDEVLLLLSRDFLSRNPGEAIIFTVSGSGALETEIPKWGGKPIMCAVGHSIVENEMHDHKARLGGEQSGHFFLGEDYFGYDDAFFAALRVLQMYAGAGKPFSELFTEFPRVYQEPELRPHCPDGKKAEIVQSITAHFQNEGYPVNTLDGARIDFGEGAWAGIRQSNTSPKLSICMEARSEEKLKEVNGVVLEHLKGYPEVECAD